MTFLNTGRTPFIYLAAITILSVGLILLNSILGLGIPFSVEFLIGYVGALLVFVIWHALLTKGWKRALVMFSISFLAAYTAEALGVNFGLVFGRYHYSAVLGFQVFGVPVLAALAWEPILYAAFTITDILAPARSIYRSSWARQLPSAIWMALVAALATTAWDMMIDPIAVSQKWWVWENGGPYISTVANGVPIQNFLGWLSLAFLINLFYRLVNQPNPVNAQPHYLAVDGPLTLYSSLFLTAAGVALTILQHPEVVLIGLLAMGPFISIALTNVNLVRQGLAVILGSGWPEADAPTPTPSRLGQD
jgi:uncharacterized membrane protein